MTDTNESFSVFQLVCCLPYLCSSSIGFFILPVHQLTLFSFGPVLVKADKYIVLAETAPKPVQPKIYYFLLISFTIGSMLMTGVSVHLIARLMNTDMSRPIAISLGVLLGTSHVGVRMLCGLTITILPTYGISHFIVIDNTASHKLIHA